MQAMLACSASYVDLDLDDEISPADTIPLAMIDFDDTAVFTNIRRAGRARTNSDWPPAPKAPEARRLRRAGVYKAITQASSIIKLK